MGQPVTQRGKPKRQKGPVCTTRVKGIYKMIAQSNKKPVLSKKNTWKKGN